MTWVKCAHIPVLERSSPKAQNPPNAIIQEILEEFNKEKNGRSFSLRPLYMHTIFYSQAEDLH